jgi:hypothetical protein
MINLSEISASKKIEPPRILLYGPPKTGKTTFASQIPGAIILDVEGGSGYQSVARITKDQLATYGQFLSALEALATQEHSFSTVVIDTVDWLEQLIFRQVCEESNAKTIEEAAGGYGKGYVAAYNLWKQVLETLEYLRTQKGMAILLIAHSQIRKYSDPMRESYDIYGIKLHDKDKGQSSASMVREWCDCILFVNQQTFVQKEDAGFNKKTIKAKGGDIIIHTVAQPAFQAGNRWGLPAEIPFSWDAFSNALNERMTNNG